MKRKNKFFWNDSYAWLYRWYGITSDSDRYLGHSFVEANGRVFFVAKLCAAFGDEMEGIQRIRERDALDNKVLNASPSDYGVFFVKPMSAKATLIDVLREISFKNAVLESQPILTTFYHGISWIDAVMVEGSDIKIRVAVASARFKEDYAIKVEEYLMREINIPDMKPVFVLLPGDYYSKNGNMIPEYVCFSNCSGERFSLYKAEADGNVSRICGMSMLFGYNENTIFVEDEGKVLAVERKNGEVTDLGDILKKQIKKMVYVEREVPEMLCNAIAFVDSARDEFFFYQNPNVEYPGKCALIGIALSKQDNDYSVIMERVECPDCFSGKDNPLIFDGYSYVWRLNNLWSGYKIFRRDGSLKGQFLVGEDKECAKKPLVFTSPTCVFVEWDSADNNLGRRLSYSTSRGMCQMLALDDGSVALDAFFSEVENRIG